MKLPEHFNIPDLGGNSVHLWSFPIPCPDEYNKLFESYLSDLERNKIDRLIKPEDRKKKLSVYGLMRLILSEYLQISPGEIGFCYTEKGKPYVPGISALSFNLSHTGNRVLFALSAGVPIGVDIEYMNRKPDTDSLIKSICSESEAKAILGTEGKERRKMFYRSWTRKEAILKGKGIGITVDLKKCDTDNPDFTGDWSIKSCNYWEGYSAAVALPAENPRILLITDT